MKIVFIILAVLGVVFAFLVEDFWVLVEYLFILLVIYSIIQYFRSTKQKKVENNLAQQGKDIFRIMYPYKLEQDIVLKGTATQGEIVIGQSYKIIHKGNEYNFTVKDVFNYTREGDKKVVQGDNADLIITGITDINNISNDDIVIS